MKRRATIKDIAAATGVSSAAVSAVLSGGTSVSIRVSEETRAKILAAARDLDYVPNQRARSLRQRASRIITVITYEKVFPVDWRDEFYRFFVGIEEESARLGYDLLILNNAASRPGGFDQIGISDGAVVIGISKDEESLMRFHHSGFPVLFVGRREMPGLDPNYATFDYETPIRDLAARVAASGFSRAAYFAVGAGEPLRDKRAFAARAFADAGVPLDEYLAGSLPSPDRVADSSTFMVFNTMACADTFRADARNRGLRAGRDYQAAVLEDRWQDDDRFWTCLDSDRIGLGKIAVERLVALITGTAADPVRVLLPVRLLGGASAPDLGLPGKSGESRSAGWSGWTGWPAGSGWRLPDDGSMMAAEDPESK